jgi:hypothetical protein
MNVDTGKLNLNKFMTNLKNANLSVRYIKDSLGALGPQGV